MTNEMKMLGKQIRLNAIMGRGTYIKSPGVKRKLERDIRNLGK